MLNSEIVLSTASFLILVVYHTHLVYIVQTHPLTTDIGITNHLRGHSVESIRATPQERCAAQKFG